MKGMPKTAAAKASPRRLRVGCPSGAVVRCGLTPALERIESAVEVLLTVEFLCERLFESVAGPLALEARSGTHGAAGSSAPPTSRRRIAQPCARSPAFAEGWSGSPPRAEPPGHGRQRVRRDAPRTRRGRSLP